MNKELQILLAFSRRLPVLPLVGRFAGLAQRFYLRKPRDKVLADVLGVQMELNPAECVDHGLLFAPHLYDHKEIAFLRSILREGDTFLDIGANIGFYSLVAAQALRGNGKVLAIEADPYNFSRLSSNIELNAVAKIVTKAVNLGISDKFERLSLVINTTGNRGGSSFLATGSSGVEVDYLPLHALLERYAIDTVKLAKIDIEGFELRVLSAFFNQAPISLWPQYLIIEINPYFGEESLKLAPMLLSHGYAVIKKCGLNSIFHLKNREKNDG